MPLCVILGLGGAFCVAAFSLLTAKAMLTQAQLRLQEVADVDRQLEGRSDYASTREDEAFCALVTLAGVVDSSTREIARCYGN